MCSSHQLLHRSKSQRLHTWAPVQEGLLMEACLAQRGQISLRIHRGAEDSRCLSQASRGDARAALMKSVREGGGDLIGAVEEDSQAFFGVHTMQVSKACIAGVRRKRTLHSQAGTCYVSGCVEWWGTVTSSYLYIAHGHMALPGRPSARGTCRCR